MSTPIVRTPNAYFLVKGVSEGHMPLNAFDGALLDAGIGDTNLVKMSSIVPPRAVRIEPVRLPAGALVPVAYASINSNIKGQTISAAVAAAFPKDPDHPGVIMEYSATGSGRETERICRDMAAHALQMRGLAVDRIESVSASHHVVNEGAAFAAVVLWNQERRARAPRSRTSSRGRSR